MEQVRVRIINPNPQSIGLGYTKGRMLMVPQDQAEDWIRTRFAERVTDGDPAAAKPADTKPAGEVRRRTRS